MCATIDTIVSNSSAVDLTQIQPPFPCVPLFAGEHLIIVYCSWFVLQKYHSHKKQYYYFKHRPPPPSQK